MDKKNKILVTCPVASYGGSTGLAPIQVRIKSVLTIIHKIIVFLGWSFFVFFFIFLPIGIKNLITDASKATTPPNFDGIERKIAYANKKYHSGWMWIGVANGLASLEFSVSPINKGICVTKNVITIITIKNGVKSFVEK